MNSMDRPDNLQDPNIVPARYCWFCLLASPDVSMHLFCLLTFVGFNRGERGLWYLGQVSWDGAYWHCILNGLYSESGMKFSCEMMLSNSLLSISSPWFCHHCLGKYVMLYGFVAEFYKISWNQCFQWMG
jgi:hypothetical protein